MNKLLIFSLALLLVSSLILTSCTTARPELPVDPYRSSVPSAAAETFPDTTATASQPKTIIPVSPVKTTTLTQPARLALAAPPTYAAKINFDPAKAQYFDEVKTALNLSADELTLLQKNGFVATDRLAWDRFLEAYAWIYWKDLPVLVTTDSILQAVHQSYDDLLTDIERSILMPRLKTLLESTQQEIALERNANTVKELDALYLDVAEYLSVALALLNGKEPSGDTEKELFAFAVKADTYKSIKLFGNPRDIDFTLFTPRGHYTRSADLQQYFRSMSWLGQIDFRFVEFDPGSSQPVLHQNQIAAAAILRLAVDQAGQRAAWNEINSLLEALVGKSDNVTLPSLDRFFSDIGLTDPAAVLHADNKSMLEQWLNHDYGNQRITGQLIGRDPTNFSPEPVPRPVSFMLMGQRFVIDSYVLGNLVYDRMIKDGSPILRALPSTLDVMYTLGNNRAGTHLTGEIEKYGYDQQLATLRAEVDSLPQDFWESPFYNQWLDLLRRLNQPTTGEKYPQAMRTAAWADKMLQTQLASWTQLRHDNILYAKQSVTTMVLCQYPEGYVEPYPEFYAAVFDYALAGQKALSGISTAGAGNLDYITTRVSTYFQNVMAAAEQLKKLAEKELALQKFTDQEEQFLKSVVVRQKNENRGCGGPEFILNGWYPGLFYREDASPALIADVHTNPNDIGSMAPPSILHAATGPAVPLCLAAETDEGSTMYVGPVFTYYDVIETGHPPVRLTDSQWQERLDGGRQPAHPAWTQSFLSTGGKIPEKLVIK